MISTFRPLITFITCSSNGSSSSFSLNIYFFFFYGLPLFFGLFDMAAVAIFGLMGGVMVLVRYPVLCGIVSSLVVARDSLVWQGRVFYLLFYKFPVLAVVYIFLGWIIGG